MAAGEAQSQTSTWQVSTGDWSVASNWNGGEPTSGTIAFIENGGTVSVTQPGATCADLDAGSNSTVYMTGGGLSSGNLENLNYEGIAAFIQSGGTNNVGGNLFAGNYNLSGNGLLSTSGWEYIGFGTGTFTQTGGTNDAESILSLGTEPGSSGTYNLMGGLLTSVFEYLGQSGTGTITQSGGTHMITGTTGYGLSLGANGTYNMDGGLFVLPGVIGSATFNFNGGTLEANIGFSTSTPMTLGTSGGGATFDTAGFAVTLSGSLSGPGSLTKLDSGTLTLAATNTYSGNTLISGGTLLLGSGLALQDSTLDTSGSGTLRFGSLTAATFGGLTGPGPLTLGNTASAAVALSVGNNNANTTYSGALQGAGSLIKIGGGVLALTGSNAYSGSTTVTGGTLQIGNGGSGEFLASPSVSNSGVLAFDHADALTYGGAISGSGAVVKTGSGTLALTGSNTYSGPTTISRGKLAVDGWLTNSAVAVNGGTLGGTGSLTSVTVYSGGNLAPGDPQGVLHLSGTLNLASGAAMDYDLDGLATDNEVLMPSGQLILSDQQFSDFDFTVQTGFGRGTYTLIDAELISGSLGPITSGTVDGYPATLAVQGNGGNQDLVLSVTPEPSSATLLGAGVLGLIGWAWRLRLTRSQRRR
jgi:autotransporter-associated beta strand protein